MAAVTPVDTSPAGTLRRAADALDDTRNCDGYDVDCNSRELLTMASRLFRARPLIAKWLRSVAEFCDQVEVVHGTQPSEDNLSVVDALDVARAVLGEGTAGNPTTPGPVVDLRSQKLARALGLDGEQR